MNKLDSAHTQLPYEYYSLPFCQPSSIEQKTENLGEILSGDKIENSLYEISARLNEQCKVLCSREYSAKELKQFATKIHQEYQVNWIVDNLPSVTLHLLTDDSTIYERGFPGFCRH